MDGADPDLGRAGAWLRVCPEEAGRAVPERLPGLAATHGDIPYNAMLIGAADAHIEQPLGTVDEAAAAIDAGLVRLTPG